MSPIDEQTIIRHDDLPVLAQAAMLRLPLPTPEARRIVRLRELLDVSDELSRLLAAQTHAGRLHCQADHAPGDLVAETETLCETLARFGALVHEVAGEYRPLLTDRPVPADVEPATTSGPSLAVA